MRQSATEFYSGFSTQFAKWAGETDDIHAAFVIGSQARADHPADNLSDMDILLYTSSPDHYLGQSDWLNRFGKVLCSFSTFTTGGDPERLTLFEGGYQVDFVVAHSDELVRLATSKSIPWNFYRGVRVLVDKNAVAPDILPSEFRPPSSPPVSAAAFSQVCDMFWFGTLYLAKQILRKELWGAKARDQDVKNLLLQMIEWYEKHVMGPEHDTWHAGRFMGEWASRGVLDRLGSCFGRFDAEDSWNALLETAGLFSHLSGQIAAQTGYPVPGIESHVDVWLASHGQHMR